MDADVKLAGRLRPQASILFPVHEVEPEMADLPRISMGDSLRKCLNSGEDFVPELVAVSDLDGAFVELPAQNGLLAAVHVAFSRHRPLTLSPDMIWLAILQGFGRHVAVHAAELEGRLMRAPGRHMITIEVGRTACKWPEVFDQFAQALENHAGDWIRSLQSDFSTTGKIERAASQVALMDLFSPYVAYVVRCVCGIPSISLRGEPADWIRLQEKLALLRGYEADEWIDELDEILSQFVAAAHGKVDRAWWQGMYKLMPRYGGEDIEGWLGAFFPYLKDDRGTFTHRRQRGEKITTEIVPPGLSDVRFTFITPLKRESLRAVSGFVGVEDLGPEGVSPKIGWAIVRNHFMEIFVQELDRYPGIGRRPPAVLDFSDDDAAWDQLSFSGFAVDLQLFYQATNGADLYGQGAIDSLPTVLSAARLSPAWTCLGYWNDGSLLLTNGPVVRLRWTGSGWEHQTLGVTFSDFIARLVAADGSAYWQDEHFEEPEIWPAHMAFSPPAPIRESFGEPLRLIERQNGRLRSMKLTKINTFTIRPPSKANLDHLPAALRDFYATCDGVSQAGGFELWPAARAVALVDTRSRWYEIGEALGCRIIFDCAANRGVAVIDPFTRRIDRIANSIAGFLRSVEKAPLTLYWAKGADGRGAGSEESSVLWPDEAIDLGAESQMQ